MSRSSYETCLAAARSASDRGDYRDAIRLRAEALAACAPEEEARRAHALAQQAHDHPRLGQFQASVRCAGEAVALAEQLGDAGVLADALTSLSFVYAQLLMGRDAMECGLRALAAARSSGDARLEGWALNRLGVAYAGLDNPGQACDTTVQALEVAEPLGDAELQFSCLNNLSYFWLARLADARRAGDAAALAEARGRALQLAERATALARESASPFRVAVALSNRVEALLGRDDHRAALPLIDEYEALSRDRGYLTLELQATTQRALILKAGHRYDDALALLSGLMDGRSLPPKLRQELIHALYETHKARGDYREALAYLEQHAELERQLARDTMALQTEVMLIRQEVEQAHARAEHALQDAHRERERARQLEHEQVRLRDQAAALDRAAHEDVLTGLNNRRHAEFALPLLLEGARLADKPVCLAMLDVDHFKAINDEFGHGVGDLVLQQLAQLLRLKMRSADLLARVGGEEFLIALVGASCPVAQDICERLRLAVRAHDWSTLAPSLRVSVSIGLAGGPAPGEVRQLQERADRALYSAKRGGRDRVCVA
ncbi:GGDEF domain-containing protein [Roseateles sp. DAIF2]|uniref:GGDEF domain-containing protein n=1 Tax=Roseateles sp. DAIF2 TaxID=2714952 RepID=UPI0018A28DC9|nr:GGDEF domain-containing protein [Roseateles sp. DAIF2]QPF75056.1 GGDEF domain-containing protein [Roseateles sp. DAIF2]